MPKQIKIRIYPDGTVRAETVGIKGPSCTGYVRVLENLLDAEATESAYTPEYYELEDVGSQISDVEQIRAQ